MNLYRSRRIRRTALFQLVMLHASGQRNQCKHSNHHHCRQRDCDRRHELCPLGSPTSEPTLPSHYLVCSLQHKSPAPNSLEPQLLRLLQPKRYDLSSRLLIHPTSSQILRSRTLFLTAKGPPGNRATLSLWEAAPTEAKPSERSGARVCSPPGGVKTQFLQIVTA